MLDLDGQPINEGFNFERNLVRATEGLLGIIRGILADCELNENEIRFLDTWIQDNPEVVDAWPGNILARRLNEILEDGIITKEESDDLKKTLSEIIGGGIWEDGIVSGVTTSMGLDEVEKMEFRQKLFCLTGKFLFGSRKKCEEVIVERGGMIHPRVTNKLDFLIVGALASRDWINSTHGRKMEQAIANKEKGLPVLIVGEKTWEKFL